MFSKISKLLSKVKKDRPAGKISAKDYLKQADLSEKMMRSIGIAMKLDLKVYVRLDIGNQTHAFAVQGKNDPTLDHLYDVAYCSWKSCVEAANEAILDDQVESRGWEGPDYDRV